MPEFVDTHSHLFLPEFDEDRKEVVDRAVDAGVTHIFLPNIDSSSIHSMNGLADNYPGICHALMGLHPTSVKENYREELSIVENELKTGKYAGIGEIGIDLYWDRTFLKEQSIALSEQLEFSLQYDLPVIIHARESFEEILKIVTGYKHVKGIFHAFSGSIEIAKKVTSMGFLIGVGGMVTYKKSELPDVVREIPLEFLVLETDSPYLTPVPHRGKRNESSYIPVIAQVIGQIKNISLEEVAMRTTSNARNVFRV